MDPINLSAHRLRRTRAAAVGALRAAAQHLLAAIPEIEGGTFTREADELMLEIDELLIPLEQYLAEEIRPEHLNSD